MSDHCMDENLGNMLHAYELGMLSDQDKDALESHLLDCQHCFDQLKEFAPRGTILSASPQIRQLLEDILCFNVVPERCCCFTMIAHAVTSLPGK